jgi:hypothetical protein
MEEKALLQEAAAVGGRLLAYCRANDWAGHDPYDALNSPLFSTFPRLQARIPRLVLTQLLKRSPIDLRGFLRIPKTQNPKAIALFLSAIVKDPGLGAPDAADLAAFFVEKLAALRSTGTPYWCWGYSFPWQTRTTVVPRGAPNLVCTTFAANALLDAHERRPENRCLEMACSAAEYILNELFWTRGSEVASFSYPLPTTHHPIHNANFLAAALLCRVYKHTGHEKFLEPALYAARYSAAKQAADGSWAYGEAQTNQWIDNFHTGYNLGALRSISEYLGTTEFDKAIRRGFHFYRNHFFRADGAARYFHHRTHPIDIHCTAQSIITLLQFKDLDPGNVPLAYSVLRWAIRNMWNDRGFFYYRSLRSCTIRIPYMRWSEAWMLLAIATLLHDSGVAPKAVEPYATAASGK